MWGDFILGTEKLYEDQERFYPSSIYYLRYTYFFLARPKHKSLHIGSLRMLRGVTKMEY